MTGLLIAVALSLTPAPPGPSGPDGAAVLKKVQAAYAALTSYSHHTSSTEVARINGQAKVAGGLGELRMRRPNRLYVVASTPSKGSVAVACDGSKTVVYRSALNVYRDLTAAASPSAFLRTLLDNGVYALPGDPLAFVCGVPAAQMLQNVTVNGAGAVNGVPCIVLSATARSDAAAGARASHITMWVDKKTYLVWKVERAITGLRGEQRVTETVKGKRVQRLVPAVLDETVTELVQDMQPNANLPDSAFAYSLPRGARRQSE